MLVNVDCSNCDTTCLLVVHFEKYYGNIAYVEINREQLMFISNRGETRKNFLYSKKYSRFCTN